MTTNSFGRTLRIGVDSGGTFTDVCLYDPATAELTVWKVSSTPHDPSEGIAAGMRHCLASAGRDGADVAYFGHGTTVATNALIQRRNAKIGMITTAGFRDVIEIRRQTRASLYDLQIEKTPPLVPRDLRLEVHERVRFDGAIEKPLDDDEVRTAVRTLRASGVESVAVCFIFGFLSPVHEARVKQIVTEEMPEAFVSVSHEVAPEIREYERFSTVVVNAALGPIMKSYLEKLTPRLAAFGVNASPHLTQSNGGIISAHAAAMNPVRTILSGPAAGVMGALAISQAAGIDKLVTFDMGGTSTDVALIEGGSAQMARSIEVHGHSLKVPMLDINTVGAGGGSIAYVDSGSLLKVGPRSAGADPGPVCYGLGNEEPTVTDANVVLQTLNPTELLNGRMKIDRARAVAAVARLAERLGLDVMRTAQGIISVVTANMAKAIRVISVERGYDPRDYALMAFGGAGPLHAARLARELDIRRVLVPRNPGILCAMGLLMTDLRTNFSDGRMAPLSLEGIPVLAQGFERMERQATGWFKNEGIAEPDRDMERAIDMRYVGQGHELPVPCPLGPIDHAMLATLRERFEFVHRQVYGFVAPEEAIQAVTLRLTATGRVPKAKISSHPVASTAVESSVSGHRDVWFPESNDFVRCPIYDRELLHPGHILIGPAIVEQMDSTTILLPRQTGTVDTLLNIMIEDRS